jgi:hypothetical protein
MMKAINQVDMGQPRLPEEDVICGRSPCIGMRCRVIEAEVCLGLDDTSAQDCPSIAMDKDFAE